MNKKWIITILIGITILGIVIWLTTKKKEQNFKNIVISDNNIMNTIKEKPYLDTIIYAGIKSLDLKGLVITIDPLSDEIKKKFSSESENLELKAFIIGDENTYIIYVDNNLTRKDYIYTFSHELIHLKQYYTKEFIMKNNIPYWKGKEIILNNISYQDRPWEIEAFANQKDLETKMNKFLY